MMLKTLDVIIGLAWVMVVVSMAVTMLTQAIISLKNTRGSYLKTGIQELLQLLDRGITPADAKAIAERILLDPLVAEQSIFGGYKLATAVHREELMKLILGFAAGIHSPEAKYDNLRTTVVNSLQSNGIADSAAVLDKVRATTLELERTNPELANYQRLNLALLEHAATDFLGKLYGWFDQTMDRVSARFTTKTRGYTVIAAIIVAFTLQLDTIDVVNRLSTDNEIRKAFVDRALENVDKYKTQTTQPAAAGVQAGSGSEPQLASGAALPSEDDSASQAPRRTGSQGATGSGSQPVADSDPKNELDTVVGNMKKVLGDPDFRALAGLGIGIPNSWAEWKNVGPTRFAGVILSALLLSLGAPFWYELLKNLLKLRSMIATKDDQQREERQTAQTPAASPAAADAAGATSGTIALAQGEKGDLNAIG